MQYSDAAHGSPYAWMVRGNGAKKCTWKPMKFITSNSKGNYWPPAKSNSVGTAHSESTVTQECPSAHRLAHPPALLPWRLHHKHLSPLPLLGMHCTSSLLLGSTGERGWTSGPWRAEPASSFLPVFHAHPPSLIPCPSLAQRKQVKARASSFTLCFTAYFPVPLDEIKPWIASNNYFAYCLLLNLETVYFLNNYF